MRVLLTLILLLFISQIADAQILRRLQDRAIDAAERNIERRVERKLDEYTQRAVDNAFDKVFGEVEPSGTQGSSGTSAARFSRFLDMSNVTTEDEYLFNFVTTFQMEAFGSDGASQGVTNMIFHYNESELYTGTRVISTEGSESSDVMIIYDLKNEVMVMMMASDEQKFSIAYKWAVGENESFGVFNTETDDDEFDPEAYPDFEYIGSKIIHGFQCEGYRTTNDDSETEIWVTKDIPQSVGRMFEANRSMPMVGGNLPSEYPSGLMIESVTRNLSSGEYFVMRTTEIDQRARKSFKMSEYPLMNFGE